jgi:hypothetical protein
MQAEGKSAKLSINTLLIPGTDARPDRETFKLPVEQCSTSASGAPCPETMSEVL